MKIIGISDIHNDLSILGKVSDVLRKADLVLISGDITHFGGYDSAKNIISQLLKVNKNILAVPGNCDLPEVNRYLIEHSISVDCRIKEIDGLFVIGVGGSLPCPGATPGEYSEEEFETLLSETSSQIPNNGNFILLIHQPPFNTKNDKLVWGKHVGSHAVRNFVEARQPAICLCGHIHEGIGVDRIGNSLIGNPGPFRFGKYVWCEIIDGKPITFEVRGL